MMVDRVGSSQMENVCPVYPTIETGISCTEELYLKHGCLTNEQDP